MLPTPRQLTAILVEDEPVLLMLLEDMLSEEGINVAGSAASVDEAVALATSEACDFAILDANIIGGDISPVFEAFKQRGVPVIFCTGSPPSTIHEKFGQVVVLAKPYVVDDLKAVLLQLGLVTYNPSCSS